MKVGINYLNYSRCWIFQFSEISKIISKDFYTLTNEIVSNINWKTTLYLLDEKCKNEKFINYFQKFNEEKINIEKYLLYVFKNTKLKYIIKYNNLELYNRLVCLAKDNNLTSKEYTTINSYLNRSTYNSIYGGFTSFYSPLKKVKKNQYSISNNKIELCLIEEKNKLLNIKLNKKCYFLNQTLSFNTSLSKMIFYVSNSSEEHIIQTVNYKIIYNLLKNKVFYNIEKLKLFISKKLNTSINDTGILVDKFIKIWLISYSYKFKKNNDLLNSISSRKIYNFNKNIYLNPNNIYDILNKNQIKVDQKIYSDFEKTICIYEYFLSNQLKNIWNELEEIKKISWIKKNEKVPVLEFIVNNFDTISLILEKRKNYKFDFENKVIDIINDNAYEDIIILDNIDKSDIFLKKFVSNLKLSISKIFEKRCKTG